MPTYRVYNPYTGRTQQAVGGKSPSINTVSTPTAPPPVKKAATSSAPVVDPLAAQRSAQEKAFQAQREATTGAKTVTATQTAQQKLQTQVAQQQYINSAPQTTVSPAVAQQQKTQNIISPTPVRTVTIPKLYPFVGSPSTSEGMVTQSVGLTFPYSGGKGNITTKGLFQQTKNQTVEEEFYENLKKPTTRESFGAKIYAEGLKLREFETTKFAKGGMSVEAFGTGLAGGILLSAGSTVELVENIPSITSSVGKFGKTFVKNPIITSKSVYGTLKEEVPQFGSKLGGIIERSVKAPTSALGYVVGETIQVGLGSPILEKAGKATKATLTALDPRLVKSETYAGKEFLQIKAKDVLSEEFIPPGLLGKVKTKVDNAAGLILKPKKSELEIIELVEVTGKLPKESAVSQSQKAGSEVTGVSAARNLFGLTKRQVEITPKEVGQDIIAREAFFADPEGRLRLGRLGKETPTYLESVGNVFSGNIVLSGEKKQAAIFQKTKVAEFPAELKTVEQKLFTGERLTIKERYNLLKFQLNPTGEFKPIGRVGSSGVPSPESEITLAPGDIIKQVGISGKAILRNEPVTLYKTEVLKPTKESSKFLSETKIKAQTVGLSEKDLGKLGNVLSESEKISTSVEISPSSFFGLPSLKVISTISKPVSSPISISTLPKSPVIGSKDQIKLFSSKYPVIPSRPSISSKPIRYTTRGSGGVSPPPPTITQLSPPVSPPTRLSPPVSPPPSIKTPIKPPTTRFDIDQDFQKRLFRQSSRKIITPPSVYKPSLFGIDLKQTIPKAPKITEGIGIRLKVKTKKKKRKKKR